MSTTPDSTRVKDATAWEALRHRTQRRTLAVVVLSQILGGAGLAAGITVGALLAQEMLGDDGVSGLPTALFTLGSALAAYLVGRLTQRSGRRPGLGLGFMVGGLGAIGVVIAAVTANAPLLFLALFVYGAGTATNLQARYAGTDVALPQHRGRAVSIAMVSTTLGAVAGPNLVTPMGAFAESLGIPALAGPFLLAAVAYLAASAALILLLHPDPFLLARTRSEEEAAARSAETGTSSTERLKPGRAAYLGAVVMVLGQIVMVAIMTMTPVHMRAHGHTMSDIGLVIGLHIAAMYLPSLATGALVDKIGRLPMAVASAVTLLLAGVVAAAAPGSSLPWLTTALILLGLGWNFGVIAGTALVVDATVPENRARTQGSIDVLIAVAGAGGGAASGVVLAGAGFAALTIGGGVLALVMIPALLALGRGRSLRTSSNG